MILWIRVGLYLKPLIRTSNKVPFINSFNIFLFAVDTEDQPVVVVSEVLSRKPILQVLNLYIRFIKRD